MLETILRDMACSAPHKSAVGVNTSQERCDNVSITQTGIFVVGSEECVYVSSTATVSRRRGAKGPGVYG